MDFSVISDNLSYFLLGAYPDGPLGGAALTLVLSALSGIISALLGLVLGVALVMMRGAVRDSIAAAASASRTRSALKGYAAQSPEGEKLNSR